MSTLIQNAQIFDGHRVIEARSVLVDGGTIAAIGADVSADTVVDATGCTLLPGLIDAHVHTNKDALRLALRFGVTTELEMQGVNTRNDRADITGDDSVADVRSSGFGVTPPGGHPSELFPKRAGGGGAPRGREPGAARHDPIVQPHARTPEEVVAFIPQLVAAGSDYIKFMVDDGTVEGHPGLPCLDEVTLKAGVAEARRHGMLTIAHALTVDAALMAVDAGVHGLAHLFMDRPHTERVIDAIAGADVFVVACVSLDASMMGITGGALADDPRVAARLTPDWDDTLRSSFNRYPQGELDDVLASVRALHEAGVDILVGTDVSQPFPFLGGLAPDQALRAATSTTARRFGLADRGVIAVGMRADLLLVDGDPTARIDDTLNIREVWRRGTRLGAGPVQA